MDDKKLNELLNKALASLTDEQKAKAKACKTAKELLDFLAEAGVELPDEVLEKVAGGGVTYISYECPADGGTHNYVWNVSLKCWRCTKCHQWKEK